MVRLPPVIEILPRTLDPIDLIPERDLPGMRNAGVLILLFPREDDVRFLLTARPDTLARHAGQISLPGGRMEPDDLTLWHTARRETEEELGIRTGRLVPLGRLDPTSVTVSRYVIWPFVAWSPVAPRFIPDPHEVAAVLEVSLSLLLSPETVRDEQWNLRGTSVQVTLYRFGDVAVWGATARVLSDLAIRLRPELASAVPRPGDVQHVS